LLHPLYRSEAKVDDVDVVVPVHDDIDSLRALLESLSELHVTVVDDASSDAQAVAKCAQRFGADIVRLEENLGPGSARNAGAQHTTRPLLWFIDVDVTLDNHSTSWLDSKCTSTIPSKEPSHHGSEEPTARRGATASKNVSVLWTWEIAARS